MGNNQAYNDMRERISHDMESRKEDFATGQNHTQDNLGSHKEYLDTHTPGAPQWLQNKVDGIKSPDDNSSQLSKPDQAKENAWDILSGDIDGDGSMGRLQ